MPCATRSLNHHEFSPEVVCRDNHALHLGGSLVNLGDLGVAISPLHWIAIRITGSPVDLDRLARHPGGRLRGEQLRHRCFCGIGAAFVLAGCGTINQETSRGDLRSHVSYHPLNSLETPNRLAELETLLRVRNRRIKRSLGNAQRLRTDSDPPPIERLH